MKTTKALAMATVVLVPLGIGTGAAVYAAVTSQEVLVDTSSVHMKVVHTVADGFDSGWHVHPGPVIVHVQRGYLKIYQDTCYPKVIGPGETYIEGPGIPIRGVATGTVEWTATLLTDSGIAQATPATDPCAGD